VGWVGGPDIGRSICSGQWNLEFGAWCLEFGLGSMVGSRYFVEGSGSCSRQWQWQWLEFGAWNLVLGTSEFC